MTSRFVKPGQGETDHFAGADRASTAVRRTQGPPERVKDGSSHGSGCPAAAPQTHLRGSFPTGRKPADNSSGRAMRPTRTSPQED